MKIELFFFLSIGFYIENCFNKLFEIIDETNKAKMCKFLITEGGYKFPIKLGEEGKWVHYLISSSLNFTKTEFLSTEDLSRFKKRKKEEMMIQKISYHFEYYDGYSDETFIVFSSPFTGENTEIYKINQLHFFTSITGEFESCYVFGFDYNIKEEYSIIHQLREEKVIDKLIITLMPDKKERAGHIIFGDFSSKILDKDYDRKSTPISKDIGWGNRIKSVKMVVGGEEFIYEGKDEYGIVDPSIYEVIVSNSFLTFLSEKILVKEEIQNKCTIDHYYQKIKIKCDKEAILLFQEINIELGNVKLSTKDLFLKNLGSYELTIQTNYRKSEKWYIGISVLNNYITKFDFENQEIAFYYQKEFPSFLKVNIYCLLICNIFISIFGSLINGFYLIKSKLN